MTLGKEEKAIVGFMRFRSAKLFMKKENSKIRFNRSSYAKPGHHELSPTFTRLIKV